MGQIALEKNVDGIEGLCVITPAVHGDKRGCFMDTCNQRDMEEGGLNEYYFLSGQSKRGHSVVQG